LVRGDTYPVRNLCVVSNLAVASRAMAKPYNVTIITVITFYTVVISCTRQFT